MKTEKNKPKQAQSQLAPRPVLGVENESEDLI